MIAKGTGTTSLMWFIYPARGSENSNRYFLQSQWAKVWGKSAGEWAVGGRAGSVFLSVLQLNYEGVVPLAALRTHLS